MIRPTKRPMISPDDDDEFCASSVCVLSPGSVCVSMTVVAAGTGLVTSTGKAVGSGVELSTDGPVLVLLLTGGTKWCVGAGVAGFVVGFGVTGVGVFAGVGVPGAGVGKQPGAVGSTLQPANAAVGANTKKATTAISRKRRNRPIGPNGMPVPITPQMLARVADGRGRRLLPPEQVHPGVTP